MNDNHKMVLHTYEHFGMEKEWLAAFFASPLIGLTAILWATDSLMQCFYGLNMRN